MERATVKHCLCLTFGRDRDVPLPAYAHLSALCSSTAPWLRSSPLPPRMSCAWLAWKKCGPALASLFPCALKCKVWLLLDCSRSPWRFWHEKQPGLSGLSHCQWSRTKAISSLPERYNYQRWLKYSYLYITFVENCTTFCLDRNDYILVGIRTRPRSHVMTIDQKPVWSL